MGTIDGARATRAAAFTVGAACLAAAAGAYAQTENSAEELAKKLSNPVSSMISVPFQFNYDAKIGPARDGHRFTMNLQPVIPIELNRDWNVISRTILPLTDQHDIFPGAGSQSGLGDTLQSFFFSPKKPTAGGWIWGAGPVLLLPTGSDDLLSARKWAAGPTGVALKQEGAWTYGILFNHLWSFAGDSDRSYLSNTFLQPFVAHTTKDAWTYSLNTESTYDWNAREWTVPVNASIAKLVHIGKLPVSFALNARYWAESPDNAPHGWGARFVVTLLFPT